MWRGRRCFSTGAGSNFWRRLWGGWACAPPSSHAVRGQDLDRIARLFRAESRCGGPAVLGSSCSQSDRVPAPTHEAQPRTGTPILLPFQVGSLHHGTARSFPPLPPNTEQGCPLSPCPSRCPAWAPLQASKLRVSCAASPQPHTPCPLVRQGRLKSPLVPSPLQRPAAPPPFSPTRRRLEPRVFPPAAAADAAAARLPAPTAPAAFEGSLEASGSLTPTLSPEVSGLNHAGMFEDELEFLEELAQSASPKVRRMPERPAPAGAAVDRQLSFRRRQVLCAGPTRAPGLSLTPAPCCPPPTSRRLPP